MSKTHLFLMVIMILLPLAIGQGCSSATQISCGAAGSLCQYFTWNNGTCVAPTFCPITPTITVWSNSTFNCEPCQGGSSTVCQSCLQYNFYFNTNRRLCTTCANTYGSLCLTCNSDRCLTCREGFQLSADLKSCFDGKCPVNYCQTCADNTTCSACDSSHYLFNNFCVCNIPNCEVCSSGICLVCYSRYQTDSTKTKCNLICIDNCDVCEDSTTCTTCAVGYIYDSSIKQCVVNCAAIDPNCNSCTSTIVCSSCASGYSLSVDGKTCNIRCSIPNCVTCSPSTNCTQCSSGFRLVLINGTTSFNCSSDICGISFCASCAGARTCARCVDLYVLSAGNTSCQPNCNISNCAFCTTPTICRTCNDGFRVQSGVCSPICSISNCRLCATPARCSQCDDGFITSNNAQVCNFNCRVVGCINCISTTTCSQCYSGASVAQNGTVCAVDCRDGFYLNTTLNRCIACPASRCLTCDSVGRCLSCLNLNYRNNTDFLCYPCSNIANCFNCDPGSAFCTICRNGFTLINNACLNLTCSVTNCQSCVANSTTVCLTCNTGYSLANNSQACQQIVCSGGQYLVGSTCTCGPKLIFTNGQCTACSSDTNCLTCSNSICTNCKKGYYPSGSGCIDCSLNCQQCDSTGCEECKDGFVLRNGGCLIPQSTKVTSISRTGDEINCDPGCRVCDIDNSDPPVAICRSALDGYTLVAGVIYKCGPTCKTCLNTPDPSTGQYSICLTCLDGYTFNAGSCTFCTDLNAITCRSTDASVSLTCKSGYTLQSGTCQACSPNCLKCGVNKAKSCDLGGCMSGFFQSRGFTDCVKCFNGCLTCAADPNVCLDCGDYKYLQNNACFSCSANCIKCTSGTSCQTCVSGYAVATGGSCRSLTVSNCVGYDANFTCTKCDFNYVLNNGLCVISLSCNATRSCTSCRAGFYLSSGSCLTCPNISNCNYCDQSSANKCINCVTGFYLHSRGTCIACPKAGCAACSSQTFCTQSRSGYYLVTDISGAFTGDVLQCGGNCLTCFYSSLTCLSCQAGSTLIGTTCLSNENYAIVLVASLIVLSANQTSSYELGFAYSILARFFTELASKLGYQDLAQFLANSNIVGVKQGSIQISLNVNTATTSVDPNTVLTSNATFTDVSLVSHSIVTNDIASSSLNLGLVLGVAIPLGVLLIVIIIVLKVKSEKVDQDSFLDGTEKQIDYQAEQF